MFKAFAKVGNIADKETNQLDTFIVDGKEVHEISFQDEGEKMSTAIGKLMGKLHSFLMGNEQFKNPIITINGVKLTAATSRKFRQEFAKFRLDFGIIRNEITSAGAFDSHEAGVAYIRETDRNGVFAKVNKFTPEQIAAQVVEQRRLVKDLVKWAKADAKDSVITPEVAARRLAATEQAKAKRLAAQAAAKQIAAATTAAKNVGATEGA